MSSAAPKIGTLNNGESWRTENIRQAPPTTAEWSKNNDFHNAGLATWETSRAAWKVRTQATLPPAPPPIPFEQLVSGLTVLSRTFELPNAMKLSDLIDVYQDIWEADC